MKRVEIRHTSDVFINQKHHSVHSRALVRASPGKVVVTTSDVSVALADRRRSSNLLLDHHADLRSGSRISSVHVGSLARLVRPTPPPIWLGIAVVAALMVVESLVLYPLQGVMTPFYPGMIYIVGVLVASMVWGMWLGMATAVASTAAFVFFHVQPINKIVAADIRQVVGLAVLLFVAVAMSAVADLSRLRTVEAEDADLSAEMARLLLHADDLPAVLPAVAQCVARSLKLPDAVIDLAVVPGDDRHSAFPLCAGAAQLGTLLVPVDVPERTTRRLRERVVPSLASLLHAGRDRAAVLDSLEASRARLGSLAAEQAALGRVANLVAHNGRPAEVFDAITTELHGLLGEQYSTWLCRFENDATASTISTSLSGLSPDQVRLSFEGDNVPALVWDTGRVARMDSFEDATGPIGALARELGVRSVVGAPIVVEGRLWGAAAVGSTRPSRYRRTPRPASRPSSALPPPPSPTPTPRPSSSRPGPGWSSPRTRPASASSATCTTARCSTSSPSRCSSVPCRPACRRSWSRPGRNCRVPCAI
ncbi:DUF4118 domain-containing protein [Dactylosporangium cerinum]